MESCDLSQDNAAVEKPDETEKRQVQVNEITECSICIDLFTDPRILPCIHTFCLKCLSEASLKTELKPGDSMPCPLCKTLFVIPKDGIAGLQRNVFMERLVEVNKISRSSVGLQETICEICSEQNGVGVNELTFVTQYCIQCQKSICDRCSQYHRQFPDLTGHQIFHLGESTNEELLKMYNGRYCGLHTRKELEMYCTKCDELVCVICFSEKHNTHDCSHIEKAADTLRSDINKFIEEMKLDPHGPWSKIKELLGGMDTFLQEVGKTEGIIIKRANELKAEVDRCTKSLLNELAEMKEKILKQLTAEKEEIERHKAIAESFQMYCSQLVAKGSVVETCRNASGLRSRKSYKDIEKLSRYYAHFNNNQKVPPIEICFNRTKLESLSKEDNIVGSLLVSIFPAHYLNLEDSSMSIYVRGVAKLANRIYVLHSLYGSRNTISIFENQIPFCLQKKIETTVIGDHTGMVPSEQSNCLYICDRKNSCIWKLTTDDHRLTKFVSNINSQFSLSICTDGRLLLLLGDDRTSSGLKIYGRDGKHIHSFSLPAYIQNTCQCIQTSNGEFMISHKGRKSKQWIITHLCSYGQNIIRQFHPRDNSEESANCPFSLFLDSGTDQPVVFDSEEQTVIQFDSNSRGSKQILRSTDGLKSSHYTPVFYDSMKKQLFLDRSSRSRFDIYQL